MIPYDVLIGIKFTTSHLTLAVFGSGKIDSNGFLIRIGYVTIATE